MPSYPFLSDEWLEEARKIRAEYEGKTPPVPHVGAHEPRRDRGALLRRATSWPTWTPRAASSCSTRVTSRSQDLKVTVDYDTAKAILIEGNPQAGMQAFMAGKVASKATWPS